jgi:hypothetical protein
MRSSFFQISNSGSHGSNGTKQCREPGFVLQPVKATKLEKKQQWQCKQQEQ